MPMRLTDDEKTVISTWNGMIMRCTNPNNRQYADYGGRGIKVCDDWRVFKNFFADVGPRPPGMTFDRIDNDGDYAPGNWRWASRHEQQMNRRMTIWVEHEGRKYSIYNLMDISGLAFNTIVDRIRKGLSFDDVVNPQRKKDMSGLALGPAARRTKSIQ